MLDPVFEYLVVAKVHVWCAVVRVAILLPPPPPRTPASCPPPHTHLTLHTMATCAPQVRGQHTKTTGRAGKTVGVAKKK